MVCGEGGGERREESTPKIGSNKLSTIFAGLNTLKRLEIRLGGGPFVHGAPCRPGMKDCNVLSRKRDENRVQLSKPSSRTVFRDSPPTLTKIYIYIDSFLIYYYAYIYIYNFKIFFIIFNVPKEEKISECRSRMKWKGRNLPFRRLVFRWG